MTTDYSRPRKRLRSFSAGLLSGNAISQDGVMEQLQENVQFRLQSARAMLMGDDTPSASPLQRRQALRDRRRELMGSVGGPLLGSGDDSDSGGSSSTSTSGSGQIGTTTTTHSNSMSQNNDYTTPSMSDVDRGTKERAEDRGFEN